MDAQNTVARAVFFDTCASAVSWNRLCSCDDMEMRLENVLVVTWLIDIHKLNNLNFDRDYGTLSIVFWSVFTDGRRINDSKRRITWQRLIRSFLWISTVLYGIHI